MARPRLKTAVGFSWNNLRQQSTAEGRPIAEPLADTAAPASAQEQADFTEDDLQREWLAMCNRMPQQLSAVATRMKNMTPVIREMPQVEVTVDNALALEQMQSIKGSIVNTLKQCLHNSQITLDILQTESVSQERALTRREQYEEMEKENPAVGQLRELLSLELA